MLIFQLVRFKDDASYEDCPEYMMENSYTIGCRIPLKNHDDLFNKFFTKTFIGGKKSDSQVFESLSKYGKRTVFSYK